MFEFLKKEKPNLPSKTQINFTVRETLSIRNGSCKKKFKCQNVVFDGCCDRCKYYKEYPIDYYKP